MTPRSRTRRVRSCAASGCTTRTSRSGGPRGMPGPGEAGRPADRPGEAEEVGCRGGEREAAPPGGAAGEGTGPEPGRTGSSGKSFRALGNDLRGRGLRAAAEPVADDAFTGVESELGITAACRLTGRSRATHYRRLRPAPERKPRKPQVQPSALTCVRRGSPASAAARPSTRRRRCPSWSPPLPRRCSPGTGVRPRTPAHRGRTREHGTGLPRRRGRGRPAPAEH